MGKGSDKLRLQVGGTVNPRTEVYIVRPSDDELLELLERGEYANVLCSRQMGKTSLLLRTKSRLQRKGFAVAAIDVGGYLGSPEHAEEWYQGLLDEIARQIQLSIDVRRWWKASRGITPNQRLIQFFREITEQCDKRLVVFLDEIDSTFKLPYADDFFVAIRAMYNDRPSENVFERITFCLAGVASPNELIKDRRTTSYNVGRTIELQDFDPKRDNLTPLFQAMRRGTRGESIVNSVLNWTGGHPYLTVRLCERLTALGSKAEVDMNLLIEREFASLDHLHADVHFQQILRFLSERVDDMLSTLALYKRILVGERVRDHTTPSHIALKLAGLVKRDQLGYLIVRNALYARIFSTEWIAKTLEPTARPFDNLLDLLAQNRDLAADEYKRLRQRLVRFFLTRGISAAEDLADNTLDRIANRLDKGEIISDLEGYTFGVAQRVLNETLKQQRRQVNVADMLISVWPSLEDSESESLCLESCLNELSESDRKLILAFYEGEGHAKIVNRRILAESMGLSFSTLRVRVHRIRQRLERCIRECLANTE